MTVIVAKRRLREYFWGGGGRSTRPRVYGEQPNEVGAHCRQTAAQLVADRSGRLHLILRPVARVHYILQYVL